MKKSLIALIIGIMLIPIQIFAQGSFGSEEGLEYLLFEDIPKITVASLESEDILTTVSSVSVIDKGMINKYNFRTISEALKTIAGVHVARTAFMNTIPLVRGMWQNHYANKVLIMINNVPTWNSISGEGYLNRVDINDVDRIEVLKGPASVLYGTNAYVGCINIVLKKAKENEEFATLSAGYGSNEAKFVSGNYLYNNDKFSFSIFGNGSHEIGELIPFTDRLGVSGEFYDPRYPVGSNFTCQVGYAGNSLMVSTYYDKFANYEGSNPDYATGGGRYLERKGTLINYKFEMATDKYDLYLSAYYDTNVREFPKSLAIDVLGVRGGDRLEVNSKSKINLSDTFYLVLGLNYEQAYNSELYNYSFPDRAETPYVVLNDETVTSMSFLSQVGLDLEKLKFLIGARLVDHETFGNDTSLRGTIMFKINDSNVIKIIAGESFRSPNLFELYSSERGNADLMPEYAETMELLYMIKNDNLFFQIVAYSSKYTNLVKRYTTGMRTYYNSDGFKGQGLEIEVKYKFTDEFDLFLSAEYLDGNTDGEDINFKYIADYMVQFGVFKKFGNVFTSAIVDYIGGVSHPLGDISASTVLDLNIGYLAKNGCIHTLSVKNLTDEDRVWPGVGYSTLQSFECEQRQSVLYTVKKQF